MSFTATSTTAPAGASIGSIDELLDQQTWSRPTLLTIWAHPDDESFLGAGLMAEIARRGGRVVSVTATHGEHGTQDPIQDPPTALAVRRHRELERALEVLGAESASTLDYVDGGCADIPEPMAAARLGAIIDAVDPDLVLSFGSDGVTGHPDHQAVARWTVRALAEHPHVPLLTTAAGAVWPSSVVERMRRIGAFWPDYPERILQGPYWSLRLDGHRLDQKLAALACHASQVGPTREVLGPDGFASMAATEAYRPANRAAHLLSNPTFGRAAA